MLINVGEARLIPSFPVNPLKGLTTHSTDLQKKHCFNLKQLGQAGVSNYLRVYLRCRTNKWITITGTMEDKSARRHTGNGRDQTEHRDQKVMPETNIYKTMNTSSILMSLRDYGTKESGGAIFGGQGKGQGELRKGRERLRGQMLQNLRCNRNVSCWQGADLLYLLGLLESYLFIDGFLLLFFILDKRVKQ